VLDTAPSDFKDVHCCSATLGFAGLGFVCGIVFDASFLMQRFSEQRFAEQRAEQRSTQGHVL
jgi:hypothetical protein